MSYQAPLKDMRFVLNELAGLAEVAKLPGYQDATPDTVDAILEQASKFASEVLDPINHIGDQEGSIWKRRRGHARPRASRRRTSSTWRAAGARCPSTRRWAGRGCPSWWPPPVEEMLTSSNMSFSLCPLLTQGAIHALELLRLRRAQRYLPRQDDPGFVDRHHEPDRAAGRLGPGAGADPGRARKGDHYKISGQKIFITYGEHDLSENIVHLVLARTPQAPEGVKGISLFLVPKFIPNKDGTPGKRNSARCASIEHKLGIHASPTAVMVFDRRRRLSGRRGEQGPRRTCSS